MVIKTASPGVYLQEIDLTRGAIDPISTNLGFLAGPFERGPVDQVVRITTEVEMREVFGKPTDENYEYWWTVDNFLEYSGQCYVVRCDDSVGDEIDDSNPDGLGKHPQKMRNATDAFSWAPDVSTLTVIDQSEATTDLYVKNEDEYITDYNELLPTGGKFFSRNPGTWANGLGVAVIDAGADYQLRLSSTRTALSIDDLLIVNGGNAAINFEDTLAGGTAGLALQDAIDFNVTSDTIPAFGDDVVVGAKVAQYAKLTFEGGEAAFSEIADMEIEVTGSGIVCPAGTTCEVTAAGETIIPEVSVTGGSGEGLLLDLFVVGGAVTKVRVALRGAGNPEGYKESDVVTTNVPGATTQAQIRISEMRELEGTVITVGNLGTDGLVGVIVREESGVYTVAVSPKQDGTFGTANSGDDVVDPYLEGAVLGTIEQWVTLGEYVYYNSTPERRTVDIIFEPQTYTRDEGMAWLWPNRPFLGETVYKEKTAKNVNGVAIKDENGGFAKLEGPATVTQSTGDIISWNGIKERWVQTYVPKVGDVVFDSYVDPNDSTDKVQAHTVVDAYDWYSQQIAFEGIPWIQFGPRPGTSAHAEELGCEKDEVNIIVYDALGDYYTVGGESPQKGRVIESYILASKLKGATTPEGSDNFYKNLINKSSQIIFSNLPLDIITAGDDTGNVVPLNSGRTAPNQQIAFGLQCAYLTPRYGSPLFADPGAMSTNPIQNPPEDRNIRAPYLLLGGADQLSASLGELQHAYRKAFTENVPDLDYILQGPAYDRMFAREVETETATAQDLLEAGGERYYPRRLSESVAKANYLISLADELKTCIACVSPPKDAALDPIDSNEITEKVIEWANRISSSSYAVMDSGYKYMYDRFRDQFMYTPLNADTAGCMVRTQLVSQPFFSPGGMVRGQIKNVVKLGFDPSKNNRDLLYSARVNPIVTFPGEGTVMYGDKTALGYASAFDRINVRKLFLYMEKAIAKFARSVLFEFNDVPTRLNFVNTVAPFLTDIVSKRGATDFLIVCDTSNNTPSVIDRNEFVADIYVKPNRSINFVQLSFVATKTGVSFDEAVATNRRVGN